MHPTPRTPQVDKMSSTKSVKNTTLMLAAAIATIAAFALLTAQPAAAAKKKKLPVLTSVTPNVVLVGDTITLKGKNFIKGKRSLTVIFQRSGSKRRFTVRAKATSTKKATLKVPNVTSDMLIETKERPLSPTDNVYRIRLVTKVGASKALSPVGRSPRVVKGLGGAAANPGGAGDCDLDGILNAADADDDNDLLDDATELKIGTDVCAADTDGDGPTDYYEYRVAVEFNGGSPAVLPYPGLMPRPNPLVGDASKDFDGDYMSQGEEFRAWQYTKNMDRFYSDADQDSDDDNVRDGWEDEDGDRMPNLVEIRAFGAPDASLNYLLTDSDGDGLCDGLDDQDHDGPATPLSVADCTTAVPNNGLGGTPPTDTGGGDPNPGLIDADDNEFSNYYEWYTVAQYTQFASPGASYDPCMPIDSHYCPHDQP